MSEMRHAGTFAGAVGLEEPPLRLGLCLGLFLGLLRFLRWEKSVPLHEHSSLPLGLHSDVGLGIFGASIACSFHAKRNVSESCDRMPVVFLAVPSLHCWIAKCSRNNCNLSALPSLEVEVLLQIVCKYLQDVPGSLLLNALREYIGSMASAMLPTITCRRNAY